MKMAGDGHKGSYEFRCTCPWCGSVHDRSSGVTKIGDGPPAPPENGDLCFCIVCGEWAVYANLAIGGLRKPNSAEFLRIGLDADRRLVREAWAQARATFPGKWKEPPRRETKH